MKERLGKKVTDLIAAAARDLSPEDPGPPLDLSDISDDGRRPSDEFEGMNDMSSKQNMKIQINIGSKSVDDMTRKIMVEEELRKNQPIYSIRGNFKLDSAPKLASSDFIVESLEVTEEPITQTTLKIRAAEDVAKKVYIFLKRVGPIRTRIELLDEGGRYICSSAKFYRLYILNPSPKLQEDMASRRYPGPQMLALHKFGQITDFRVVNKKLVPLGLLMIAIYPEDLERLAREVGSGLLDKPYEVFIDSRTIQGLEFNRKLVEENPEARIPHIITVDGLDFSSFGNKHSAFVQTKIMNLLKPYGAISVENADKKVLNWDVRCVCSRQEAIQACLENTNKLVYGTSIYVSARNSQDEDLREEVQKLLNEKHGERDAAAAAGGENEQGVKPQDKVLREIDFFVDGVEGRLNRDDFEVLFNDYGLVINENHKDDQRFSFITMITSEEKALKASYEMTGTSCGDTTIVVNVSQRESTELAAKSKTLSRTKLNEVRKKEMRQMEAEAERDQPDGVKKFYYYVDGITNPMTKFEVASIFQPYGKVLRALPTDDKYFTFVDLETTEESAIDALLDITGREFFGNTVKVQFRYV